MSTFAGIDWGGAHHQLAVVGDDGRELFNERYPHTYDGVTELTAALTAQGRGLAGAAIERSDGVLVDALHAGRVTVFR